MNHYFEQLADGFLWKSFVSIFFSAVTLIEGFYGRILWAFVLFVVVDFITGILKSKKNNIPIESSKLRASVTKFGAYMLLITCVIVTGYFEPLFAPLSTPLYWYFIFTEFKSIIENVEACGVVIPKFLTNTISNSLKDADPDDDNKGTVEK